MNTEKHMEIAGEGQTMIELGLIIAIISIAALLVLPTIGDNVAKAFKSVSDKLGTAVTSGSGGSGAGISQTSFPPIRDDRSPMRRPCRMGPSRRRVEPDDAWPRWAWERGHPPAPNLPELRGVSMASSDCQESEA